MREITVSDLAFLANDVYLNPGKELILPKSMSASRYKHLLESTETAINSDPHGPKENGFFARAYKYKQGAKEVLIVAYRGTSSIEDALIDMELSLGQAIEQGKDTIKFLAEVLNYAKHRNILPKDIYITGHSLGGGLAQWVSMLTVDHYELFNGELNIPTAMRTVTFNPPGMQKIDPNGQAPAYTKAFNNKAFLASTFLASIVSPVAFATTATNVISKIYEIIDHQLGLKNRHLVLRMGQRAMVFAWDLMRPTEQGQVNLGDIKNDYPHIYNVSARYDMVHCCGIPGGNLINLDIDKITQLAAAYDSKNRLRHEFLDHYFTARLHYLKHSVHSAKMKIMYENLSKAANDFIYHGGEQKGIPTVKDWEDFFTGRKVVPGASLVEISSPEILKAFYGRELLGYTVTTEHSMVNMLEAVNANSHYANTEISYEAHQTLAKMRTQSHVRLHTTERIKGPLAAATNNVRLYEQTGVYPYNQTNYQEF
ncbi:Mbeg1-like protein [Piscirickettsia litoralis]|uniref:Fungal lipase-like domain-containing protein n=1 Tax=Piscirickettsia litoralis TaxID=1891921 RepID=A0ABX3A395_9GAMM|nr:Mbeg1-like protein [Piscirickettsia litoralis]ODN43337.1 hypothetical protein BGC07_10890 [Piscirickettsia litoralis]